MADLNESPRGRRLMYAKRVNITPTCRANRGRMGALNAALEYVREEYEKLINSRDDDPIIRLDVRVEKPEVSD